MNQVVVSGALGKDPEIRYTNAGMCVANYSLAVRRTKDQTDWFNIVAFDKAGEFAEKHLKKGTRIIVRGRLQNDVVEKDGRKATYTKIVADEQEFAQSKKDSETAEPARPSSGFMDVPDGIDEELPFN